MAGNTSLKIGMYDLHKSKRAEIQDMSRSPVCRRQQFVVGGTPPSVS